MRPNKKKKKDLAVFHRIIDSKILESRNMNSFAFWYEKEARSTNPMNAIVHFNLFCECGWKGPVLDIGLLIEDITVAQRLKIFLPFNVAGNTIGDHIEDLGIRLQNGNILDALFNNNYRIINQNEKYFRAENLYDKTDKFTVYCPDIEKDIELEPFSAGDMVEVGTTIIINTANIVLATKDYDVKKCYLRLRIKNHDLGFLIHRYSLPNTALQNILKTTYMVDFRYNNTRSLSKSLIEEMRNSKCAIPQVKELHFLLITKAYVNVSETAFSRVRMIEHNVWAQYVADNEKEERDTTELVAYHYIDYNEEGKAEKNGMYPSELFTKFQVEKSVAVWYIVLTVLLGALGSGVAAVIQRLFFNSSSHVLADILTAIQSIQSILERLP